MARKQDTYNNYPFGRAKSKRRHSFVGTLLFIILLALSLSFSVALLIAYFAPYVSPSTFGSLTIVGIFAPILFVCVAACMLLWIVMWRWRMALALLIVMLPGILRFSDFYNIDIMREGEIPREKGSFTVMSYNVRCFNDDNHESTIDSLVSYLSNNELADVVCFQEFRRNAEGVERIDSLFNRRYKRCYTSDAVEFSNVVLRTYSCYPIIANGELQNTYRGTSQWSDIVIGSDTLRLINNHLYSMHISDAESEDIHSGEIFSDSDRMMSIVDRIAGNSAIRAEHVDMLCDLIDETPYEKIVLGDFNDVPMSFVYNKLSDDLIDSFVEQGSGYGYTFRPMYGMLRIDYILHSEGLKSIYYYANEDADVSDHLPLLVRLKFEE
jgi:endonuclease/exonuclease/phosphatase family metal-dependent hydrolase